MKWKWNPGFVIDETKDGNYGFKSWSLMGGKAKRGISEATCQGFQHELDAHLGLQKQAIHTNWTNPTRITFIIIIIIYSTHQSCQALPIHSSSIWIFSNLGFWIDMLNEIVFERIRICASKSYVVSLSMCFWYVCCVFVLFPI